MEKQKKELIQLRQFKQYLDTKDVKLPQTNQKIIQIYKKYLEKEKLDWNEKLRKQIIKQNQEQAAKQFKKFILDICLYLCQKSSQVSNDQTLFKLDKFIQAKLPTKIFPPNFQLKNDRQNMYRYINEPGKISIQHLKNKKKSDCSQEDYIDYALSSLDLLLKYYKSQYRIPTPRIFQNALQQAITQFGQILSGQKQFNESTQNLKNYQTDYYYQNYNEQHLTYQKELKQIIVNSVPRQFQHGLSSNLYQSITRYSSNKQFLKNDYFDSILIMQLKITHKQKQIIDKSLEQMIKMSNKKKLNVKQKLEEFFDEIKIVRQSLKDQKQKSKNQNNLPCLFYFVESLYKKHSNDYCVGTRRALLELCILIKDKLKGEKQLNKNNQFCIVHTFKVLESQHIERSHIGKLISKQPPQNKYNNCLRNSLRYSSQKSEQKLCLTNQQSNKHLSLLLSEINIFNFDKKSKIPNIQFVRLTSCEKKRNVNFYVSGFLSEDTDKFDQWKGLIGQIYDSEIYALKWESQSIKSYYKLLLSFATNVAPGMINSTGFLATAFLFVKQAYNAISNGPFTKAFQSANLTGIYLAQLLIKLFDGHFINLAGFSLGTQVIFSTLTHLKSRGKLHMINRIITMGGVADKKQIENFLNYTKQSEKMTISIRWQNIYCQTDYILKYLFRILKNDKSPIGLQELNYSPSTKQNVCEINNINVTGQINGHLTYRDNLNKISKIIDMMHE